MKLYQSLMNVREKKNNKKGFTLVELIVVLVILAILAAILVPALLGYIDRAKTSQYELEAKSVYMAAQAAASEAYASDETERNSADMKSLFWDDTADELTSVGKEVAATADVANLDSGASSLIVTSVTAEGASGHDAYTIKGMVIEFKSAKDGNKVTATLANGVWSCTGVAY